METIQIVPDKKLLQGVDLKTMEARGRAGYTKNSDTHDAQLWEAEAVWPEE